MPATASPKTDRKSPANGGHLLESLSGRPQQVAKMMTRASEIIAESAKDIWSKEIELLRLEAEQMPRIFSPAKQDGSIGGLATDYYARWHDGAEKLLARMRSRNDAALKCGWDLLALYSEALKGPGKSAADQ